MKYITTTKVLLAQDVLRRKHQNLQQESQKYLQGNNLN